MNSLPAGPAGPLHILPPWLPALLWAIVGFVALTYFLAWLRRRPAPAPAPPARPAAVTERKKAPFEKEIDELEEEILGRRAFRHGCHSLAALVRRHLEARSGLEIEEMTGSEVARTLRDRRPGALLIHLAERQFGVLEPERRQFVEACGEARELLGDAGLDLRRKGGSRD